MSAEMITTNQNFHSSVNIGYDLSDAKKIYSFISTPSACQLIENLVMSASPNAASRAKLLVGAYGRGKSHIVLMALSLLSKKDPTLFLSFFSGLDKTMPLFSGYAKEYVKDKRRLLPVVITGNNANLAQSFLQALKHTLRAEGLEDLMPDTNIEGVLATIDLWKSKYPETFAKFADAISVRTDEFISALKSFDISAYNEFLELYPSLTSGGVFNSFHGLDVVETFNETVLNLKNYGFDGIYVVYDEFSKYLETNIADASLGDIKLLQDFAEKCNRSENNQMHLLMICHKDIANYIDGKLPKERIDGWRGVSGRFEHIEIRNGFSQSYELIESSILKDEEGWNKFTLRNKRAFELLKERFVASNLIDEESANMVIEGCYPLHPVTTFLLPRISEKVAQNERTLFTYLVSNEKNSLTEAYSRIDKNTLDTISPDNLFDYFEPLFRKEPYTSEIHGLYELTTRILSRLERNTLEAKIVKTIMLIYAVSQFEALSPSMEQVVAMFQSNLVSATEVKEAVETLIKKEAVIYLRKSNGFLKLKESSGVDIEAEIQRLLTREKGRLTVEGVLNEIASGKAIYPSRHNDKNEIVRYFQCKYVSGDNFWSILDNGVPKRSGESGHLLAVIPFDKEDLKEIKEEILEISDKYPDIVFILPKRLYEIYEIVLRYKAALILREEAREDTLLADEYDVLLEDYSEVIAAFNSEYFQPELKMAHYYQAGERKTIRRKAQLSELLSKICDEAYPKTPFINNESINKNELSPAAVHSRTKILSGLCSPVLEQNLGLQGNGQECSIMRSVFAVTGIIENIEDSPTVNLEPETGNYKYLFDTIRGFFYSKNNNQTMLDLYKALISAEKQIGLKRGLAILFIALALREDWNNLLLVKGKQEQRLTAGALNDMDRTPEDYQVRPIEWTEERAGFVRGIKEVFSDHLLGSSSKGDFDQAVDAMIRWYLSLPRFVKTTMHLHSTGFGSGKLAPLRREHVGFRKSLKRPEINPREFLFNELPSLFGYDHACNELLSDTKNARVFFDSYISATLSGIADYLRSFFEPNHHPNTSLSSAIIDWREGLDERVQKHVFSGSANRILESLKLFTRDESVSLKRLLKAVTSLRIEDWDEKTVEVFIQEMASLKEAVEGIVANSSSLATSKALQISYSDENGKTETRTFSSVTYTPRARLLKNEIENALDEMGQSIDESEKRQVLFDILRRMC